MKKKQKKKNKKQKKKKKKKKKKNGQNEDERKPKYSQTLISWTRLVYCGWFELVFHSIENYSIRDSLGIFFLISSGKCVLCTHQIRLLEAINVYPCKSKFFYIKVGFKGVQNYICMFSWCELLSWQGFMSGNM